MITRRWFLGGLIAAPVVMQADRLMPLRGVPYDPWVQVQSWPLGTQQPDPRLMAEVKALDDLAWKPTHFPIRGPGPRPVPETLSFGGVVLLSSFQAERAKWERLYGPMHFAFCDPPRAIPWESTYQGERRFVAEATARDEWGRRGMWNGPGFPGRRVGRPVA